MQMHTESIFLDFHLYMRHHEYYVYILTNKNKNALYTGMTNNLSRRVIEHYQYRGNQKTFTGKYQCYHLVYYEMHKYVQHAKNLDTLYFLSARKAEKKEERSPSHNQYAYRAYRWFPSTSKKGGVEARVSLGSGFSCSDEEGGETYFTQTETKHSPNITSRTVIYRTKKGFASEDAPLRFAFDDDSSSFGHPHLSLDGTLFFFVSDKMGGFGGTDIYFCRKLGNKWTKPMNAGSRINTADNELFPFYLGQGILVFSSNGRAGFGGYDLYASRLRNEQWSDYFHLPWPINSKGDDLSFRSDKTKKTFYVSSNRAKGKGGLDIYKVQQFTIADLRTIF